MEEILNNQNEKNTINEQEIKIQHMSNEKINFSFAQFFDLNHQFKVKTKYNLEENIGNLQRLSDSEILQNIKEIVKKEPIPTDIPDDKDYFIKSMSILTSKESENFEKNFTKLINIDDYLDKNNKYCENNCGIKMKFYQERNKIIIKSYVNYLKFSENIFENLCKDTPYKKIKKIIQNLKKENDTFSRNKSYEFDMEIKFNSINQILYTDNEIILDLQYPPVYKTNFLIYNDEDDFDVKKLEFEHVIFPFRNFKNEVANLKYKRLFLCIKPYINNNGENEDFEYYEKYDYEEDTILTNFKILFKDQEKYNKIKHYSNSYFKIFENENELKQNFNFHLNREINDYFDFANDSEIYKIFYDMKFIKDKKENEDSIQNKDLFDLEIIKFYYQILAIVSQNILSYFNAIEFLENFIYNKNNKNYYSNIFDKCPINFFPVLFNETLTRILDIYQNMQDEFTMITFENKLKERFEIVYNEFLNKGINYILKPSKNKTLERIQRIIITPTYILFTPYSLDQGNRILREFIQHPYLGIISVFKMDDFDEGRWNNRFLIEYIKYVLSKGIKLSNRTYTFFDFSQSQFRNRACWLLTNPEEVLPKTGDYSKIKVVAKYGARISQTLTTTQKTIIIHKNSINFIDDVTRNGYTFSDGVGKISYPLAKKIADVLHLSNVPAAFQGRFLGCKGVWTTMYNDNSENIYIRDSQKKFDVTIKEDQYFELCDYSRYIQAYLNRQIILLLSSLGIKDDIFLKKLDEYRQSLEDEKFVLSLIHYEEWNKLFHDLYLNGITMKNDRLMKSLVDNNKDLLYNDLKSKARIYIKDSAYVIGIMDEYNILEYGEAFCHIKRKNFDLILNQDCTVAKCPCLHPGDIRKLKFKKFIENDFNTLKYKVFEKYENVLIFPSRGKRPHPNELSGSDLDGDNYFIFYDKDLIPEYTVEPMNYNIELKIKKKNNIKIKNIIKYFAEYTNLNNLGLIGDAHLAMCDKDPDGARGKIPIDIALKFSRAVDAPKTGDKVKLSEKETPKKFPHYMEKKPNKTYRSVKIIGQLYDKIEEYKDELTKGLRYRYNNNYLYDDEDDDDDNNNNNSSNNFYNNNHKYFSKNSTSNKTYKIYNYYDSDLCVNKNYENFGFLSLIFYKEYFEEIIKMLKKNEIKAESILLTGNNVDNEMSIFSKKKNNYDLRDKITTEMVELFRHFHNKFYNALKSIFGKIYDNQLITLNDELFFKNNSHLFASACYMVSYNFKEIIENYEDYLDNYKNLFENQIYDCLNNDEEEFNNIEMIEQYECQSLGMDYCDNYFDNNYGGINKYYDDKNKKKDNIDKVIKLNYNMIKSFLYGCSKTSKLPHSPIEETQYRVLSFPWCLCGRLLAKIKYLNN